LVRDLLPFFYLTAPCAPPITFRSGMASTPGSVPNSWSRPPLFPLPTLSPRSHQEAFGLFPDHLVLLPALLGITRRLPHPPFGFFRYLFPYLILSGLAFGLAVLSDVFPFFLLGAFPVFLDLRWIFSYRPVISSVFSLIFFF